MGHPSFLSWFSVLPTIRWYQSKNLNVGQKFSFGFKLAQINHAILSKWENSSLWELPNLPSFDMEKKFCRAKSVSYVFFFLNNRMAGKLQAQRPSRSGSTWGIGILGQYKATLKESPYEMPSPFCFLKTRRMAEGTQIGSSSHCISQIDENKGRA